MSPETRKAPGAKAQLYADGPDWDGTPTATIGKQQFESAEGGATLLRNIQAEGHRALLGPMEGDTWHSYRLVTESDGSAPFLMEPTSGPVDLATFEAAGFSPVAQYFSARASLGPEEAPAIPNGIRIETWDGQDPEAHFAEIHALSSEAFAANLFFKPLGLEDFLAMYMPFAPLLQRELILLARDDSGALLGYLFGIPNYAEGPNSKSAILKTYASLRPGIGHVLAHHFHAAALALGFHTAIHALIQDANRSAERSAMHGGEIFRRYALMGWRADD